MGNKNKIGAIISAVFFSLLLLFISSCGNGKKTKAPPPAVVNRPVTEDSLTTITLSELAEARLGIETAMAETVELPGVLKTGGEIIALPGRDLKITAPAAGTVFYSQQGPASLAGKSVKSGEELMRLLFIPSEKDSLSTREEVSVKEVEYQTSMKKVERLKQLVSERAASEKNLQEAEAQLAAAKEALNTARAKFQWMTNGKVEGLNENLTTLVITAPFSGILQNVYVAPGQTVSASAPLFDIVVNDPVWIRVPVFIGDLDQVDTGKPVSIQPMGGISKGASLTAKPVRGPVIGDAETATTDIYYSMENPQGIFRIGEKAIVSLPKISTVSPLSIPRSSVLYDINGGCWVYIKIAPRVYRRTRVEISHFMENRAVIRRGVEAGEQVVVTAAAELYGTEFGGGK